LFFYIGSSKNLGNRLKYHRFVTKISFLGLFFNTFDIKNFSFTVIELCDEKDLTERENYYFNLFYPL